MPLPEVLDALLTAHGPSGYEAAPARIWREAAEAFAVVEVDPMGNSTATVGGTGDGLSVAVVGHVDEIGLIVTHVDDQGYLHFTGVGGWDPQILVGQRVVVHGTGGAVLPGVIGKKPIHLLKDEERKKVAEVKDLHIDLGATDGDDARGLVRVGDVAVIAADPVELPNGRAAARAMDNRLGAFVALEVARLVAEAQGAAGDVVAVAAVQEEIGLFGAQAVGYRLRPDIAIAVDVTHATDAPGIDAKQEGEHKLGSGPVITRGSTLHPVVTDLLIQAAEAESIAYTLSASARYTGTDADAIHANRGGIPSGLVSIPLRYMHSPVEVVQLSDVHDVARLIAAFCLRLEAGQPLAR